MVADSSLLVDGSFCLGAHLARRELSVVLRQLVTHLPDPVPFTSSARLGVA